MNTWRDYMVSMGFGYPLGIDLPGEKEDLFPMQASTTKLTEAHGMDSPSSVFPSGKVRSH